jgi:hypothetical protein
MACPTLEGHCILGKRGTTSSVTLSKTKESTESRACFQALNPFEFYCAKDPLE